MTKVLRFEVGKTYMVVNENTGTESLWTVVGRNDPEMKGVPQFNPDGTMKRIISKWSSLPSVVIFRHTESHSEFGHTESRSEFRFMIGSIIADEVAGVAMEFVDEPHFTCLAVPATE